MSSFVWCKKEERRIPSYRCSLCADRCFEAEEEEQEGKRIVRSLIDSGKLKERFVMKKKQEWASQKKMASEEAQGGLSPDTGKSGEPALDEVYMMDDGRLKPFPKEQYTPSTLYEIAESFEVQCRLVKPDDPGSILYEGKKPSKKTVPVILKKDGETLFLDSWGSLDEDPSRLADAHEVLGVVPVKQVFVLKRKDH